MWKEYKTAEHCQNGRNGEHEILQQKLQKDGGQRPPSSPFMTSGHETDLTYSLMPGASMGQHLAERKTYFTG